MKRSYKALLLVLCLIVMVGCQTAETSKKDTVGEPVVEPVVSPATPTQLTVNQQPISLVGNEFIKVNDQLDTTTLLTLPTATFDTMEQKSLNDYDGWKIIHTVPSLDTPTCSLQTMQIEEAAKREKDISFITISADLPFALYRFCGDHDIENVVVLSDYNTLDFARNNHVLMADYNLLARSIMVVDSENIVRYVEYATEVTEGISVINAVNFILQNKN